MKKVSRDDWFYEGFKILNEESFTKITVDNLCKRLGVSKGSFYFHFKNIDGYIKSLMDHWLNVNTSVIITEIENTKSGLSKEIILKKIAASRSYKLEKVIRGWSFSNDTVREYIEEVDRTRIKALAMWNEEAGIGKCQSKDMAILEYSTFVGIQQVFPEMPKRNLYRLQKLYNQKMKKS